MKLKQKRKNKGETYSIAPKGALSPEINNELMTDAVLRRLELQALRQNCNALLIGPEGWKFLKVCFDEIKGE